jgi:hypothetical protein
VFAGPNSHPSGCRPRAPGSDDSPDSDAAGNMVVNPVKSVTNYSEVDLTFCLSRPVFSLNHAWVNPML